ncbi:MAG: PQQ-binding-like beta-propeller repeat protein [Candidatus Nitrosocosmicus sp.]|nr:PQQ-binding-like beta-propeller repeat protein [Candidatus Nitrosocosmicus sp.]
MSIISKVVFSLGVILIIGAVGSIYVTTLVAQNNSSQNMASSSSSSSPSSSSSSGQSQGGQNTSGNSSSASQGTSGSNAQSLQDNTIIIPMGAQQQDKQSYDPSNAQVQPNSKITWQNKDSVTHTATARDKSFDTGNISPGQLKTVTVKGQGTIDYYCTIHPWMKAQLIVSSGSSGTQGSGGNASSQGSGGNASSQGSGGNASSQGSGGNASSQGSGGNASSQGSGGNASSQGSGGNASSQGSGGSESTNAEGFSYRTSASAFKLVSPSKTELGTESYNKDNWITANHDIFGKRHSLQSIIDKDSVNNLQVKWVLNTQFPIENPPLIIGNVGYAQNNAMRVIAFDMNTGLNLWTFDPHVADQQSQTIPRGVYSHGITYNDGVIYAPTGANGTIVALNSTDGDLLWQSAAIGDPSKGFRLPSPPLVWGDYVIAGSALGDEPPFAPAAKGSITAFNRTDGERIWNISTVTGQWVMGENATKNGGATVWSGGSLDPKTGILYVPTGNAAPDFDPTSRPLPNLYTNSILAVDVKTGQILWHTLTTPPNAHDWDTAWGTSLANLTLDNGTIKKIVIGQNKMGNAFALDAINGHVVWNKTLGLQFRTDTQPQPFGSGTVWPGTQYGVEAYNANDGNTSYFAVSNMGFNYFKDKIGTSGHLVPVFDAIENGVGNGTIVAVDSKTGNIKWKHDTEFPTWVSPLVSGGLVFSGHITETGKPYKYNDFGAPTNTPLIPSGVIFALDKNDGKKLWEFNVGAPIGIGGPSIGHGTLLVTTGSPAEISSNKGGYIIAFGLPNANFTSSDMSSGNDVTFTSSNQNASESLGQVHNDTGSAMTNNISS